MNFHNEQRFDYPLTSNSMVVDAGGYRGDFAARIADKYGCAIWCFEPVAEFRAIIRARNIPGVTLLPCAVGSNSDICEFMVNNDSTGVFQQEGRPEIVVTLDAAVMFMRLQFIDLLKLNIEGSEYPVLRRMIANGDQRKCRNIAVQFHRIPNCEVRMAEIRKALSATHEQTWCEDYVWENWRLRG